jgi:hypothetical protein
MTTPPTAGVGLSVADVEARAADAYVYGFPLVLMDVTRRIATAIAAPGASRAPINQFLHARVFPGRASGASRPDLDTLTSAAWLDLSREPIVLSVPYLGRRYYVMQLCDAWTNVFASPGSRTTGTTERDFVIVGPHVKGTLPRSVTPIRAPTNLVWLLGRTQARGPDEFGVVNAIQDRYALTPLSAIGGGIRRAAVAPFAEPVDLGTPAAQQVACMPPLTFFRRLASSMKQNPPADVDIAALARFAPLGVIGRRPREVFEPKEVSPLIAKALEEGARIGQARIAEAAGSDRDSVVNHWRVSTDLGRYGTDYLRRAATAMRGLGASLPEDVLEFHTSEDGAGQPLLGAKRYVLRFPPEQLPPVHACWSVTMYDATLQLVDGPVLRHKLGSRDAWTLAADGSLPIYLHHESSGGYTASNWLSNWLPAPAYAFTVTMRLHWPRPNALDGNWIPPPITPLT